MLEYWGLVLNSLTDLMVNVSLHIYQSSIFCGVGEIAQSLASLSMKRAVWVHTQLNPLVIEWLNSMAVLLTRSHQCRRLVKKRPSMCYYVCVIMHVKDP